MRTEINMGRWSVMHDDLLARIVIQGVREGHTQLECFKRAGGALNRTSKACGFRWNKILRHEHAEEFKEAVKEHRLRTGKIRSMRVVQTASERKYHKEFAEKNFPAPEEKPMVQLESKAMTWNEYTEKYKVDVPGVGKDEPVVMNEKGGGQSQVHYRMDLLDPKALLATSKVLKEGADKYGADNWRLIDTSDHLNHLLIHVYAYLAGDKSDEHLSHAVCRALFALGVTLQTQKDVDKLKQRGE